jgi:hypothetical protein
VFQTYFKTHPPFEDQKHLTMVGTLTTASPLLPLYTSVKDSTNYKREFPISEPSSSHQITIKYPNYQQTMIISGWLLCILSLVGTSFSTKLWHLIVTQGIGYRIGFLIVYYPMLSMLNEWFVKRRGLAYSVL